MSKSRKSFDKGGIILISVVIITIAISLVLATKKEAKDMPYSVSNAIVEGYSALFETYKELGLNVKVDYVSIEEMNIDNCYVIVDQDWLDTDELLEWAEKGGTVVYVIPASYDDVVGGIDMEKMGEGKIIYVENATCLTNGWLLENRDTAYELYNYLCELPENQPIIFNEYYMYGDDQEGGGAQDNLWSITPLPIKMLVVQGMICIILFFSFAGKRFGKAQPLVSEVERTENEYIYSVAEIYKRADAWDVALGSYYHELKNRFRQLTRRDGDFLVLWRKEKMPEEDMVRELIAKVQQLKNKSKSEKLSQKEVMPLIEQIEHLMKIIDKRGEQYWKL